MGKKIFKGILITLALLIAIWFLGPRAQYEQVDTLPISLDWSLEGVDSIINAKESHIEHLKDDNEAQNTVVKNEEIHENDVLMGRGALHKHVACCCGTSS